MSQWLSTVKRWLANKLYEPLGSTSWQRCIESPALVPVPVAAEQHTEGLRLPSLLGGEKYPIAGGDEWHGPVGTWRYVYAGTSPRRRRDTGMLPPLLPAPRQRTGALRPVRMLPAPRAEVFAVSEQDCAPVLDDGDETIAREDQGLYQLRLLARQKESEQGA